MLTIITKVRISGIHGLGLFAAREISEGTVIWRFNGNFDRRFSPAQFREACSNLSEAGLMDVLTYTYKRKNNFFYVADNARFINHSEEGYNIVFADDTTEVALRDIAAGEELIENYILNYDRDDYFFFEEELEKPGDYLGKIIPPPPWDLKGS